MKQAERHIREPLFHIAKRDALVWWAAWLIRIAAVAAALVVCAVVTVMMTGENPIKVYATMIDGAIGTERRIWNLLQSLAMLLCVSLGVTPAFKMRFWNIGAEGQILAGGLATAACMIYLNSLPNYLLLIIMFVTSIIAGALWGLIPTIFKAKFNTNETLFTLMMNYVAIQLTSYFVALWENPYGSNTVGIINPATKAGWLPSVFGQQSFLNVAIVLLLTAIMYFYLKYSKQGYEISVVGESENTARYAGINVKKVIIRTMLISGAVCGLAGFLAVSGASHTISTSTAGGKGFTAIIVTWLAKFNPVVMILITFIITFLDRGAVQIASDFNLNEYVSNIITGIILFFILGSEFFINYKIIFRSKKQEVIK